MFGLWIDGKKLKFNIELGWWKGEPFALLDMALFEDWQDIKFGLTIFRIKIVKLYFSISLYEIE